MSDKLSKAEVLAAMQREYQKLEEVIEGASEAQLSLPGAYPGSSWTVKDTMAHLSAWMRRTTYRMPGKTMPPEPIEIPPGEDWGASIERLNVYYYEQNRQRPLGDVLAEFRKTYRDIKSGTEGLTEEQLHDPYLYDKLLANTVEHFQEHRGVIQPWLESSR